MFFVVSKVLWVIVQPVSITLILLLIGLLLSFTRLRRMSRFAILLGFVVLGLSAFSTLGYVLVRPLEATFPAPDAPPANVTGIIVLGGGMDVEINSVRGGYELNRAGDRFVAVVHLAQLYPDARLVLSGGVGDIDQEGEPEAIAAQRMLVALGVDPARIVVETASRNTNENAVMTRDAIDPRPGETWLLVTSAFHMPRSVGLFRKAGIHVIAWPVDYRGTGTEGFGITAHQPVENVATTTLALREWTGLLVYWMTGRIDQFVPQPEPRT
jgi:uncharacterized SAM-binding protein YcdF (DUF218 family)